MLTLLLPCQANKYNNICNTLERLLPLRKARAVEARGAAAEELRDLLKQSPGTTKSFFVCLIIFSSVLQ